MTLNALARRTPSGTFPRVPHRSITIDPRKASIVVVEDDALLAELLLIALKMKLSPAKIIAFRDGTSALAHCRTERPDLVIVDLSLPDLDGREVIRRLHETSPTSRVVVVTGDVSPTLPSELRALGVASYVDKSSPLEHAVTAIRRVLAGAAARA